MIFSFYTAFGTKIAPPEKFFTAFFLIFCQYFTFTSQKLHFDGILLLSRLEKRVYIEKKVCYNKNNLWIKSDPHYVGERTMKMGTKILVVDDDANICDLLRLYFENEGYEVKTANDGADGISFFKMYEPDLVLLDIMLPKKDGWQVCREIREISSKPIIMITAKGDVFDKVLGLELGADDFVVKPFDMKEISARVKAVLRRYTAHEDQSDDGVIKFDNIEISLPKYELKLKGKPVEIPPKELQLLYFLASNCNRVFTRDQLLDKVWGFDYLGDSRTVDVHIKRLREKLEGVSDKWTLKTVWGVGYKFELLQ